MWSELQNLMVTRLGRIAAAQDLTFAIAESCTGGTLCSAIVANPAASGALDRGFVVYSIDAKCELLGLERRPVEECAGVSEEIARAMARAAIARSHAKIGIAITGFAGPRECDEEVGLVHIAAARGYRSWHRVLHLGDIGREAVCRKAVIEGLELALIAARNPGSCEAATMHKARTDAPSCVATEPFRAEHPFQVL